MTLRLLLDQNFPRPPGFDLWTVDSTVEAIHVYDHDRGLTEAGTPDWLIYLRAAQDGFDALVTRDWHQREQPEELWVLSNLMLTVVSWRRPFSVLSLSGVTCWRTSRSSSAGSSGDAHGCSSYPHPTWGLGTRSTRVRRWASTPPNRHAPFRKSVRRPSCSLPTT